MLPIHQIDFAGVNIAITEEESKVLNNFISTMPKDTLLASFIKADDNGLIVWFQPPAGLSWDFIFFIQNLMIAQRLHLIDDMAKKLGIIL